MKVILPFLFASLIVSCAAQVWTQLLGAVVEISWSKIPGDAVDISAKGDELWIINSSKQISRWNGTSWIPKPGSAVRVGASPDGWTWVVNEFDDIYRWNVDRGDWDQMPGKLVQINAMSKDRALGVNKDNDIFLWENNDWTKLPGKASWAAIGDGDERWVVNSAEFIYRWNLSTKTWDRMPGLAKNVDVQNPCRIIVTNAADEMFIWKNNGWIQLTGAGNRSTINNKYYYTVNDAMDIYIGE